MIIIIVPMVILQTVIGLAFMDRHWLSVTRRLSAIIDIINTYPQDADYDTIGRIAFERMQLDVDMQPKAPLPATMRRPFLSRFHDVFLEQLKRRIDRPLWLDTETNPSNIHVKIDLPQGILNIRLRTSLAYAANSHIFIVWMLGTAIVDRAIGGSRRKLRHGARS